MKVPIRRWPVISLISCAILFAFWAFAEAQQPKKIPRIGFLGAARTSAPRMEAFRQGLHDLGYAEGKNIVIEYRYAEGKLERRQTLATELVRLKVDVIVAGSPQATRSAKQATSTIPIVMAFDDDLWARDLSPVSRDRAGTSRACQPFSRR